MTEITAEYVRSRLQYDALTGEFTWLKARPAMVGTRAGFTDRTGYRCIQIDGKILKAHRLAWMHVNGVWPEGEIDHINRQRSDNRIANLRDVDRRTNSLNKAYLAKNKAPGVYWHAAAKKWTAEVKGPGIRKSLGYFKTQDEAIAARNAHPVFGQALAAHGIPT